ncbi:MAG: sulfotransferase [Lautropia sp.]
MPRNFRDPIGLAVRMLSSRNPTARWLLLREVSNLLLMPLDRLLAVFERRRLRKAPDVDAPVILVVGGPRSGTTIVYQVLARQLPVTYVSNWVAAFARSPISAGLLVRRWTQGLKTQRANYYGSVAGFDGPNDGFPIWNRWFGESRSEPAALSDAAAVDMRRFMAAWYQAFGLPLLNKNNRNVLCIDDLAAALPGARFVIVERDPFFVAQSLLLSRKEVQGDSNRGWGVLGRDADPAQGMDDVTAVCHQVHAFKARLQEQLSRLPRSRYVEVDYEAFCRDPADAVRRVRRLVWNDTDLPEAAPVASLDLADSIRLPEETVRKIRDCLSTLFPTPSDPVPTDASAS